MRASDEKKKRSRQASLAPSLVGWVGCVLSSSTCDCCDKMSSQPDTAEAACLLAIAVALGASELCLGLFFTGWALVLVGAWVLCEESQSAVDSLLAVDFLHACLALATLGGLTPLDDHGLMLLHISFHLANVCCVVVLHGAEKAFSGLTMKLYFTAAWLAILADRMSRSLAPSLVAIAAGPTTLGAADLYTTPWHWCLYNLLGGSSGAYRFASFPIVCYTAFCACRILPKYPYSKVPEIYQLLFSGSMAGPLAEAPFVVRFLTALVPFFNLLIIGPILVPRIMQAYRHAKSLIAELS